jgi:hypothetical protein
MKFCSISQVRRLAVTAKVPALDAQGLDAGAGGFGHAQPVEGQRRDKRTLGGLAEASSGRY